MTRAKTSDQVTTLNEAAEAEVMVWALCRNCGHVKRMNPLRMMFKISYDVPLADLGERLVCRQCSYKKCVVVPATFDIRFSGRGMYERRE